jgi:hypothetical protein
VADASEHDAARPAAKQALRAEALREALRDESAAPSPLAVTASLTAVSVSGGSGAAYEASLRRQLAGLRACGAASNASGVFIPGEATFSLVVDPEGSVTSVTVVRSTLDAATASCVTAKLRRIRFVGGADSDVTVTFTVVFAR